MDLELIEILFLIILIRRIRTIKVNVLVLKLMNHVIDRGPYQINVMLIFIAPSDLNNSTQGKLANIIC